MGNARLTHETMGDEERHRILKKKTEHKTPEKNMFAKPILKTKKDREYPGLKNKEANKSMYLFGAKGTKV